jgi:hypothetical protein
MNKEELKDQHCYWGLCKEDKYVYLLQFSEAYGGVLYMFGTGQLSQVKEFLVLDEVEFVIPEYLNKERVRL